MISLRRKKKMKKNRRMISYEEIADIALTLLKDETDVLYGTEDKTKAESAMFMTGVISLLNLLEDATRVIATYEATTNPAICSNEE